MTRRYLSLVLSASLLAAACAGSDEPDASPGPTGPEATPGPPTVLDPERSRPEPPPSTTTTTDSDRQAPTDVDELAFAVEGPIGQQAAGPNPAGGSPVTTIGGGASVEVGAIYRGVLGTLGPDQPVVGAVVDPPQAAAGAMPLTGVLGTVPARPAAVVKIDNSPPARPQTGLNDADIVVEEEVEGGITRFAAIFHSRTTPVGPVRSGRTTDIGVLASLGSPLLMYSGANRVTDALLRRQSDVQNRSFETSSGYWRSRSRRAPSNLYTDTGPHWASADGGPPPAQFAFRRDGAPQVGLDTSGFTVSFRANRVRWEWSGTAWLRSQGSSAHTVASGERVSAANVVVIEADEVATGMVDGSGANVPEFVFVGTGPVTVFTDGRRISGIWTRPTLSSVATLTTSEAEVIELTPGRTWIEIVEAGAGMLSVDG